MEHQKKAIECGIGCIKCDACDYRDDSVKVDSYPEYLNKPCPKCGANLLTEKDLASVQEMHRQIEAINKAFAALPVATQERLSQGGRGKVRISSSGDGELKVTLVGAE